MGRPPDKEPTPLDDFAAEQERRHRAINEVERHIERAQDAIRKAEELLRRVQARLAERRRRSLD